MNLLRNKRGTLSCFLSPIRVIAQNKDTNTGDNNIIVRVICHNIYTKI